MSCEMRAGVTWQSRARSRYVVTSPRRTISSSTMANASSREILGILPSAALVRAAPCRSRRWPRGPAVKWTRKWEVGGLLAGIAIGLLPVNVEDAGGAVVLDSLHRHTYRLGAPGEGCWRGGSTQR